MRTVRPITKCWREVNSRRTLIIPCSLTPILLSACGSGGGSEDDVQVSTPADSFIGYATTYRPPTPTSSYNFAPDQHARNLDVDLISPYWVDALKMAQGEQVIGDILLEHGRELAFVFPEAEPAYDFVDVVDWAPAPEKMQVAALEIFAELSSVLNVTFVETTSIDANNVFVIGTSRQPDTAGVAFFPNRDAFVGSDVFIARDFNAPKWISKTRTNYDYEVLLHEIGHALGLKHPFEADQENLATLNAYEDQTKFTAM